MRRSLTKCECDHRRTSHTKSSDGRLKHCIRSGCECKEFKGEKL